MNIINLNSPFDLDPEIVAYTRSIAECYDRYGDKGPYHGISLTDLMDRIPVFLVNKATLEEQNSTDLLGFYRHNEQILGKSTPVIGLCLEKIQKTIQGRKDVSLSVMADRYKYLTSSVIIHEFAHAVMALPRGSAGVKPTKFYTWMEEAMANLFMLDCFALASQPLHHSHYLVTDSSVNGKPTPQRITLPFPTGKEALDYLKDYVRTKEDEGYRLGLIYHELVIGKHWLWSTKKSSLCKSELSDSEKLSQAAWSDGAKRALEEHQADKFGPEAGTHLLELYADVLGVSTDVARSGSPAMILEGHLFRAVLAGDVNECRVILGETDSSGAPLVNVNCTDINGWTPFHWVKHVKHPSQVDVAKILVEYGADVAQVIDSLDDFKFHFGDDLDWLPDATKAKYKKTDRARGAFGRF